MSGSFQTIRYEPGKIARVILDRPEARNAQSRLMLRELHEALMTASADPDVRVIVISGRGRDFSAGHDIKEMGGPEYGGDAGHREVWGRYERLRVTYADNHLAWRNIPKPTIALVQGYCIFGGWMLASAMDVVFATEEALFLPLPYPGDYWSVTWELGQRKTKEILFENRFITAREALELGFVNRVYPSFRELESEALDYAARVAENDPYSLRELKLIVNQTLDGMGFSQSVLAAFHAGASRARPAPASSGGAADTGTRVGNPFARLVSRAVAKLPLIGRRPLE